jgi:hypothetical protein
MDNINEIEKRAMTGDRAAALLLVSAFRLYRRACETLIASRTTDGECDSTSMRCFVMNIDEAFGVEDE